MRIVLYVALTLVGLVGIAERAQAQPVLLNVSYDPTREFYRDFNRAFAEAWKAQSGQTVTFRQSHGGSGAQARAVMDGLPADVVTLALAADIDAIAKRTGRIAPDWQTRLPNKSTPYLSTIVFVVRAGNPKAIKDWDDLVRPGIAVLTPNPKTSGGARWNYLAAWAFAEKKFNGDKARTRDFMTHLFRNVPILDTGARGATTNFVQRQIGDVLIAWENEAYLAREEAPNGTFDIIAPSLSIRAEPSVALVDANVDRRGTRHLADAYLTYLYSPEGQTLAAKHHFRPSRPELVDPELVKRFPGIVMVTIDEHFDGWEKAQVRHFADGGTFDQIYQPQR
jgi:sulfate/thiosulfate-binding protein